MTESTLHLVLRGKFDELCIKTLIGKRIDVEVARTDTVFMLKLKIFNMEGIPPDVQRFIYTGKELVHDRPLSFYNIENKSTIHLILRLRNGM